MKDLNSELGSRSSTPLNTGSVFLFNFKGTVKEKCFISILYQFLETGTSDRTLICLNQLLRFSGFSLYPFSFSFTVTLIIILGICINLLLLFIKGYTFSSNDYRSSGGWGNQPHLRSLQFVHQYMLKRK